MKKLTRKMLPAHVLEKIEKYLYSFSKNRKKFQGKSAEEIFTEIYTTNYWKSNKSAYGTGSDKIQTESLRIELNHIFSNYHIETILDIPCGDFNWMKKVDLSTVDYIGADIVEEIINNNIERYQSGKIRSINLDLITSKLSNVDLVFCRDCLVHFSFEDIQKALLNIKNSGSKYLLTTSFVNRKSNYNIQTGDWCPINLEASPFRFPKPLYNILENCSEAGNKYVDKSMLLWKIEDIDPKVLK